MKGYHLLFALFLLGFYSHAQTGIGTTSPINKLDIVTYTADPLNTGTSANGNLRLGGLSVNHVLDFGLGSSSTFAWIQARHKTYGTNYILALNPLGGNVGIGTSSPTAKLNLVGGGIRIADGFNNATTRPTLTTGSIGAFEIRGVGAGGSGTAQNDGADDGFLRLSAGGGTNVNTQASIDLSGFSTVGEMNSNIVMRTNGTERIRVDGNGLTTISGSISGGNVATSKISGFVSNVSAEASSRTLASSDNGMVLRCTTALTLTLPAAGTLPEGFNCMVVQFAANSPVTFSGTYSNRNGFTKTAGIYAIATVLYTGGIYIVSGEMSN
jgi:hypothetical protein